ncbi:PREDICTED: pentatricopeptide repeat-containing protein At2g17033 [Fragaria vesca subsp. vesca]|uniref:pentatricopeptide repeat-containing protein At2g17033 n=1 Tax=Fragaria vesca subsp. vesca TaxID=101020 RepID=UPI0002C2F05C|nr:PREDICTED: pentatricopeptide repeat-containing protein At2g17033 [Fragaria vesca subsp. vesca]
MGGLGSAQLSFSVALPWRHDPPQHSKLSLQIQCALTKQGQRFLTKLAANAGNPSVANKLISKFLSTSPKSTALTTLSYLLSPHTAHPHLSSLALPMYSKITEASWFEWNPKLVAALVALLAKQGQQSQSEALISETISKLGNKERELVQFHCQLVESHSKMSSKCGFDRACTYLHQLLQNSSSVYVKRRAFESMVGGLCAMDRPGEADELIEEMRVKGLKASVFEFRSVVYGYGRLGMFEEMLKIVDQMEKQGFGDDTICCNMVLSSYGAHNELAAMANWLRKMKESSVPFSVRTYNSVLNSCPTIMAMLQEPKAVPCSVGELSGVLDGDEALVVKELVGSAVVDEAMVWDSAEAKLDLHGMHLGSAYLVMLEWFEAMGNRFKSAECVVPAEVVIVCGLGKHSSVRGESPVKDLVKEMMHQMESPMRIDRKNVGCFIAKGRAVKDWLC